MGELATLLGVDKSTASRLTATLANRDFLERAPESEAFRLTPEVGRLGMVALGSGHNLIGLARAPMERLAEETSETVNLAVLKDHKIVDAAQVDGPTSWGSATGPDGRRSLTPPPTAKCCSRSQGRSSRIFPSTPLKAFTERTITNLKELNSELERVKSAGWGSTLGELDGIEQGGEKDAGADGQVAAFGR